MDRNNASESSWADQWDYNNSDPINYQSGNKTRNGFGKKVGEGFEKTKSVAGEGLEKTKSVAATGFKKAKAGTSVGFHWIKDKYQKTTQKH